MASDMDFTFDFNGLDEDLKKLVEDYPDDTNKFMRRSASQWKKDCNDKGYKNMNPNPNNKPDIDPIGKRWENVKEENLLHRLNSIAIQNKHKMFHLLENGHEKWIYGKDTGGFVPGKHWAEQTREEWRDKFPEKVEEHLDTMCRRHKL